MWFPESVTSTPRIAILPREVSSEVVTAAVARGGWGVSIAIVAMDIPILVDVLGRRGILSELPIPLATLVFMLALLIVTGVRPTPLLRGVYIVGAAAAAVAFTVTLLRADATLGGDTTYLVNRPAVVLVLLSPIVMRPAAGILWSTIGLGVSLASTLIASLIVGVPFFPGWGPFTVWGVYTSAYVVLTLVRRSQATTIPDLGRLEDETRRMALESQFEQRAAAVIHDTVLGDLTVVMNSIGPLDDRTRERFRADVATLKNPTWLRQADDLLTVDVRDAALRNGTMALVSEMQWRGLTVDMTGNNDTVVRLSPEVADAILDALRVCFENVLAHSGAKSAELVAGGSDHALTYMVIDHGSGFDPVLAVRRGLRAALDRIETLGGSVRIWSQPGIGTSVLISVPQGVSDEA